MSFALEVSSMLILDMSWNLCSHLRRNRERLYENRSELATAESIRRGKHRSLSCVYIEARNKISTMNNKNSKQMHLLSSFQPPLLGHVISQLPWQPACIGVLRLVRSIFPSIVACLLRTQTLLLTLSTVYNSYCINLAKGQTREGNRSWWMSVVEGHGSTSTVSALWCEGE